MAATRPHYASTSLYVGDLSPEVTEATLYEFFNSVGPVASIKVCRDASSRRSLRYAYVNYHSIQDAERALESLNYTPIKGNSCRIMWSQRDPTIRKSNQGNLFVKNLDKGVDNRSLHDTFSLFGNILSCKVVTDEQGKSKGYGFVHFESDEAAATAIERVNGMKIGSKQVYVAHHQKRNERPSDLYFSGKSENFTNLYTKDFPKTWTEDIVQRIFGQFGSITSIWLSSDSKGRPFACVNFDEPPCAKKAIAELHGKYVDNNGLCQDQEAAAQLFNTKAEQAAAAAAATAGGENTNKAVDTENGSPDDNDDDSSAATAVMQLFVDRAQDKSERHQNLRNRFERTQQFRSKYDGVNLYIKNLPDNVDDNTLRSMFEPYGGITSAKVMRDEDGHPKGFGFVCFTTSEEANKAIAEMHLRLYSGKPLYVGLAEQKDRRQARLQNHFHGHQRPSHSGQPPHPAPPPTATATAAAPSSGNYLPPHQASNFYAMPPPGPAGPPAPPMMNAWQHGGPTFPQPPGSLMWKPATAAAPYVQVPTTNPIMAAAYPQQPQYRNVAARPGGGLAGNVDPRLVGSNPQAAAMKKQILGEQLFPLVYQHQPTLAGKITGMMLDMDESELLMLIQSESELKQKIDEAIRVLKSAAEP